MEKNFIYVLLFFFVGDLFAETNKIEESWIRKGRIFYEFGLAYELVRDPTFRSSSTDKNYYRYLNSNDSTDQIIGTLGILDSQKELGYNGNNQKLNLEYLINAWLGVGGSLNNSFIHISQLTKNDTELQNNNYTNRQALVLFFPEYSNLSNFFNIYGLLPDKKVIQNIRTFDYDVTFHIPTNGEIDPHFRISVGRGFFTDGIVLRTGWSSGIKWKLGSQSFMSSEIFQARTFSKQNSRDADEFLETGIRFGFGFYSTWPK